MRRLLLLEQKPNPFLFLAPLNGSLAFRDKAGTGTLTGSGAVRYQAASGARTNLVLNPRFANNTTTGWSIFGANSTKTWVSNDADLDACCELYAEVGSSGMFCGASSRPRILNKTTHTISFDVKLVSGASDWKVAVQECDANGLAIGANIDYDFTPTANVSRVVVQHTPIRTGTHSIIGNLYRKSSTPSTIRFTKYVIEEGALTSPTYFDGTTGAWLDPLTGQLGTAHASPSVSQAAAWVEEGTTNTVPDPSFEAATITTNWTAINTATISKVTAHAYLGSNGGKVSCLASALDGITQLTTSGAAAANGQTWTIQARVRAFALGDVGKTVNLVISERTSADALIVEGVSSAFTLTDQWQQIVYTYTLAGGGTTAKVSGKVRNAAAVAVDFVLDAVQLEQKAYATSYTDGSLGTGYAFTGTAHASSSTRTQSVETVDEANRFTTDRGSVFLRFYPNYTRSTDSDLFCVGTFAAGKDIFRIVRVASTNIIQVLWTINGSTTGTVNLAAAANASWHTVYAEWDGTRLAASLDGGAMVVGTRPSPVGDVASANDLRFGSYPTGPTNFFAGLIGPAGSGRRPLTPREQARLNALPCWDWRSLDAA